MRVPVVADSLRTGTVMLLFCCWYLLLKCSTVIGNLPTVSGDTLYSTRTAEGQGQHPSLSRSSSSSTSLDNLYHRILDNNEFDKLYPRPGPDRRRGPPDVPPSRTKTTTTTTKPAPSSSSTRPRPVEFDNVSTVATTGEGETPESRLPSLQAQPGYYGQSKLVNQFSDRYSVSLASSGRSVRHRRSVHEHELTSSRATASNPSPVEHGASLKANNLEQAPNTGVALQHFKTDQPRYRYRKELAVSTSSTTVAPAPGHSVVPSFDAITSSSSSSSSPPSAPQEPSFILLDDSVYISPPHAGPGRTGTNGTARLDRLDDLADAVFGGRNFDEQIIFLNGPDLLDSSIEQQSSRAVADGTGRQMGKVARAVAAATPATAPHVDGWNEEEEEEEPFEEPLALPLRPIARDPTEAQLAEDNVVLVYADQHETVRLNCEVDADITSSVWLKDGQVVHVMDKKSRTTDIRFVREPFGALTITNVMLEDDGMWQCEAENARGFFFNGRPIKLIVLDPPKAPYLLIDSRRLDASNMFIPAKENAELTLACVSEGGNPKPMLSWEVLLSPGIDRHAQKLSTDLLELQEIKSDKDKDKEPYRINSGAVSEAKLPAVYRVHHNARIVCIMEHPTLKVRQNASILLDVQYTPSFAITRTPGFGYPLREGIEVSLKCDVDSNPPSTPVWQKDDGDTPVPQIGDGFLNFSSIRREHSGWYKCTSRHLNFQYSSIGYYLSVRYDPVDVTSEPVEQDLSLSPHSPSSSSSSSSSSAASSSTGLFSSSSASVVGGSGGSSSLTGASLAGVAIGTHPFKGGGQMEVELGGSVTLQCPQGSLGCWSHLDSATVRMKGPGSGGFSSYGPAGQLSLKDVVYQDAGTYKCVGHQSSTTGSTSTSTSTSTSNRNQSHQGPLQTVSVAVKAPKITARNVTPAVTAGSPLHLSVEFCANPPAYAARWLHGDRVYTPGRQYGSEVFAYGLTDLPGASGGCKETRLTYVHMHERVVRTFYFIVSSPGGVAEAVFRVNFTQKAQKPNNGAFRPSHTGTGHGAGTSPVGPQSGFGSSAGGIGKSGGGLKINTHPLSNVHGNGLDDTVHDDEVLMEPEEMHFPINIGSAGGRGVTLRLPRFPVLIATLSLVALPAWCSFVQT
ncbi:uncharacterized protein LOC125953629 [Anopheles darlingi]|uniref:uncharacterized protein LOC125953629 n=1 Tax=Anopheles darlingi TaxID=43151 RepID=UPI00210002E9|nr:uncharacterized protein LOC125953629 [Anopheles darlingi]